MNTKLFVSNLSYNTTEARLRELFMQVGSVKSVIRPVDRAAKLVRNFAFVEMETAAEALRAIQSLNGLEEGGRKIGVSEAQSPEVDFNHSYGGGFDRGGGHHGRDRHSRGDSRSGLGRGAGHRGRD